MTPAEAAKVLRRVLIHRVADGQARRSAEKVVGATEAWMPALHLMIGLHLCSAVADGSGTTTATECLARVTAT